MPGTCEFKRWNGGVWRLQKPCDPTRTKGCPTIDGQENTTEGEESKPNLNEPAFLASLRTHLGAAFTFEEEDIMILPCTGSVKPGEYHRDGHALLTFAGTVTTAGRISGISLVTVALPPPGTTSTAI